MLIGNLNGARKIVGLFLALILTISSGLFIPTPIVQAAAQATYYVDPVNGLDTNDGTSTATAFRTIEKARDAVRTVNTNMTGDIYVYLRGGTYSPSSTIIFTDVDSGTNGFNIIYSAYNGEKPVISGGKKITGWTLYDASKNIYRASAGGDLETRQLFVNGNRAKRARSTGAPSPLTFVRASGYTAAGNVMANSTIPMHNWGNKSDIEFVYKNQWTAPRIGVSTITNDGTTTIFTMKQPGWRFVTNKGGTSVGGSFNSNGLPWYIENAYELLDSEGEWYLDRATDNFYYKPRAGENMLTAAVVAPVLEELVRVEGANLDQKAHNVEFKGITFSYSTYLRVNGDGGLPDAQNNVLRDTVKDANGNDVARETIINAAVNLKYAHSIKFERDIFEHLGGTGLNMYTGSQDNLVVGSVFTDISGNGIQVGDYTGLYTAGTENYAQSTDTRVILINNDVNNSYFHKIGVEYFASTAIAASLPQDMDIAHNEISNVPYSGIHVGWGWDLFPTTVHQRTNIQYNYIHDDMMVLADGGAIYSNGPTNGSSTNKGIISNNYIQNEWNTNGALYPDEGSSWYDITDNVVNNSSRYLLIWKNTIHDINVNNTYTTTSNYRNDGTNTKVTNTTVVSNGNWPPAALAIMDGAGIEAGYQDIIPPIKLFSITAPAPITAAIGTAKTAAALGLPEKAALVTDVGDVDASVTWDLNRASYDPAVTTAQTFTVTGEVTLSNEIKNPDNIPLTTSISVSVNKIPQSQMTAAATSQETIGGNHAASMAIDGNPQTIWQTKWDKSDVLPQSITLNLGGTYNINKVTYLPRQSGSDGTITGYNVYASTDGVTFTKVATGHWANDISQKNATFTPTKASYVKLEATAGVNGYASAAEINVYEPGIDNIASRASMTASSEYNSNFTSSKAVDGIISSTSEWASKGEQNPWIQLNWMENHKISQITFYDRFNLADWAIGGTLTFSDGSTLPVSGIPNYGRGYSVAFPVKTVNWVKFQVTGGSGPNVGLSEIEVYNVPDQQPPTTTDNAPSGWVNQDTTVTLSASDNESGVATTYYKVNDGAEQTGTSVVLSEEGVHKLVYWSVDKAGNVEQAHTVTFSIDKTMPEIAVTVPGDNSIHEDSGDLTPQIALTDNLSGVDSSKTTVTLDSQSYLIGTVIPLYALPLGQHTLVVSSSDLAGNQASKTVQFTTVASIDSLKALVTRFAANKEIDKADIASNLLEKLANNDLKGFMNDVKAQIGKHISSEAANYLLRDAQYVLSQK
ncbi:discoidin domain-containing protein [Paenibacillus spongiae]|uniref:Discoidin domain-containing protein n=1 Tax=Paenibacillus spongiae TaxID=2909671 RepID=A0ABY5SET8_9BACL|nr:discoidin domain-containing protein [Paenibacillus spongiae]UVI32000.1 discoidin domain-containing protein [Paenibacillus spongiae]